jgi:hypothetical protein
VLRPIILLNEEAVNSEAEAEAIIAHELAHVAHLDWAKLLVARAATALFWFNPLVWLLARQCHQLREEAADDAVLLSDVASTDYAALLIGAARHDSKGTLLAANGVAPGRGSLKRRVTRVLDGKLRRAPARIGWGAACAMGGLLVAAPLSAVTGVTPPPSPADAVAAPLPAKPAPLAAIAEAAASSARIAIAAATETEATATAEAVAPAAVTAAVTAAVQAPPAPVVHVEPKAAVPFEATVSGAVTVALAQVKEHLRPELIAQARAFERDKWVVKNMAGRQAQPTPDQLVSMRVHGLSADYVRQLAEAGYPNLSYDELMAARIHRVTPDYIQEIALAGYPGLSMPQLTSLRIHRVTPAFIRGLADVGYARLSYNDLMAAAVHRVTPEFVRALAAAGYPRLTMAQLTSMRVHRVSPEFIQEMRSLGYDKLPPDQLIGRRVLEVTRPERGRAQKAWPVDLPPGISVQPGPPPLPEPPAPQPIRK